MADLTTKQRAIIEARTLLQSQGFNGFSFQHVADALKIRKPSLYAHFESKEDLGNELIEHYRAAFQKWSEKINADSPRSQIDQFFEMFFRFSQTKARYCPMAALTADLNTLPASMQNHLKELYDFQSVWLKRVISEGQTTGQFRKDLKAAELVQFVVTSAIGSQFMARISDDASVIKSIKNQTLFFIEEPHVIRK